MVPIVYGFSSVKLEKKKGNQKTQNQLKKCKPLPFKENAISSSLSWPVLKWLVFLTG